MNFNYFQDPDDQLFSPTVFEDVAFGPLHMGLPEDEVRRLTAWALEQVGMGDYAARVSHHLSIGEKKRVAIATALSMQPDILILDEPSAGLDPRARRNLINLLRQIPQLFIQTKISIHCHHRLNRFGNENHLFLFCLQHVLFK